MSITSITPKQRFDLMRRLEQCLHVCDDEATAVVKFSIEHATDFAAVAGRALAACEDSLGKVYATGGLPDAAANPLGGSELGLRLLEAERYARHVQSVCGTGGQA